LDSFKNVDNGISVERQYFEGNCIWRHLGALSVPWFKIKLLSQNFLKLPN
jgi:hypothetical protein